MILGVSVILRGHTKSKTRVQNEDKMVVVLSERTKSMAIKQENNHSVFSPW